MRCTTSQKVNFEKTPLFQYDTNQKLTGISGTYVDFVMDETEMVRVAVADGVAPIPDVLLQEAGCHPFYICDANGTIGTYTLIVAERPMPPDYVSTPAQRETFDSLTEKVRSMAEELQRRADNGEFNGVTDASIERVVTGYLEQHPIVGEKGEPGERGADGRDGVNGKDGRDGKDGGDYVLKMADLNNIADLVISRLAIGNEVAY